MSRKPDGNGHGNGGGNGAPPDDEWNNIGSSIANYMSQQYRQPGQQQEDQLPPDPRQSTEFCAVWDALVANPATAPIIDYINGAPADPIPSLRDIVRAFYDVGKRRAIIPEQISAVIAYCGGQMSRHINLRNDVVAEWNKARQDEIDAAQTKQQTHTEAGIPLPQSPEAFCNASIPPEYLVEPMLQRASVYTCTALTSHGKTAVWLYIALCIASGRSVAGRVTTKGRVVWLAGENPNDFAMKLTTACHHWGFAYSDLDMVIMPGAYDLSGNIEATIRMAAAGGDTALVVVDTGPAYRVDDDEDSNANAIQWARNLRGLLAMPGGPAVVVPTHPTKWAAVDNLLPRGGGAFLNEVDGNFTLWADEDQATTTLDWQGKFRGMTFRPIQFELRPCPHPTWRLRNGDPVTIKLAIPTGEEVERPVVAAAAAKPNKGGRPKNGTATLARKLLADLLVTEGQHGYAPLNLLAVPVDRWRMEFYSRGCLDDEKSGTRQRTFRRASDDLLKAGAIATRDKWVWLTHPEVADDA